MPYNIRIISTYPPRRCGIGTFSRDLATALAHFTAEVSNIRVAAIDNGNGPYEIPVDLMIDQYNPDSWRDVITHVCTRAGEARNPTVVVLQHEFGLDPDFADGQRFQLRRSGQGLSQPESDHPGLPAHRAGQSESAGESRDPETRRAQRRSDRHDRERHSNPRIRHVPDPARQTQAHRPRRANAPAFLFRPAGHQEGIRPGEPLPDHHARHAVAGQGARIRHSRLRPVPAGILHGASSGRTSSISSPANVTRSSSGPRAASPTGASGPPSIRPSTRRMSSAARSRSWTAPTSTTTTSSFWTRFSTRTRC